MPSYWNIVIQEDFWIWLDLFIIFFILFVFGASRKNYVFIFCSGTLITLMGIWVFKEGISVFPITTWFIYPLGFIFIGLGIILTVCSGIEMIEEYGGGI